MKIYSVLIIITFALVFFMTCNPEEVAQLDTTPYEINYAGFPNPDLPADNPLTKAGVQLGRMLFYEKALSKNGSQACADCHRQSDSFSDSLKFSIGVEKLPGKRQAMPIFNLAWHYNGMFWDGRSPTVRDQALKPIQDPLEMNETLQNVVQKLSKDKKYTNQFIRAFGDELITPERIGLAIEQFEFTMISNNSKFDRWKRGEVQLTAEEERGRSLFFSEFNPGSSVKGAECFHCHGNHNFTNDEFMNNGLDIESGIVDEGRSKVTGALADNGKFKVPSLRNIAQSFPYMHDGRFKTLEEVIDHYNTGVKPSNSVDILLQYNLQPGGLKLNATDKSDLVAFLKTLTDETFLKNDAFKNPF